MLTKNPLNSGNLMLQGLNAGGPTPYTPSGGLGGGTTASGPLPGSMATSPGIQSGFGKGGRLDTSPLAGSSNVIDSNNSKHERTSSG